MAHRLEVSVRSGRLAGMSSSIAPSTQPPTFWPPLPVASRRSQRGRGALCPAATARAGSGMTPGLPPPGAPAQNSPIPPPRTFVLYPTNNGGSPGFVGVGTVVTLKSASSRLTSTSGLALTSKSASDTAKLRSLSVGLTLMSNPKSPNVWQLLQPSAMPAVGILAPAGAVVATRTKSWLAGTPPSKFKVTRSSFSPNAGVRFPVMSTRLGSMTLSVMVIVPNGPPGTQSHGRVLVRNLAVDAECDRFARHREEPDCREDPDTCRQ